MIEGLEKLLEEEAQKNKNKPGKKNKGNAKPNENKGSLFDIAKSEFGQEMLKKVPYKYWVFIGLALSMMLVGAGTTVYWIVEFFKYISGY